MTLFSLTVGVITKFACNDCAFSEALEKILIGSGRVWIPGPNADSYAFNIYELFLSFCIRIMFWLMPCAFVSVFRV